MDGLNVFTAFSGYDSQCMGLDRLDIGYDLVGWSEIDKYAIQAHNAVYPQWADRNYGDISKIDWTVVSDFDLFTYSFPCTDISSAGQQKGLSEGSGTRSSLLWECRKAIEAKKPKYLLMENVKALTSKKFMPYLQKWLAYLDSMGYTSYTKVLNAKDYGVPQNRERVFIVSILNGDRYYFPKPFQLEKRLKDVLEENVDEKYYLSKKMVDCFIKRTELANEKGNGFKFSPTNGDCVAKAITTCAGNRTDDNFIYTNKMLEDITFKHKEAKCVTYTRDSMGNVVNRRFVDIANTVHTSTGCGGNTDCFVAEPKSCAMRGRNPDNPSDRKSGIPTEQRIELGGEVANCITTVQKDSLVLEPNVLSPKRNEYGKEVRKAYERGEYKESRHNMTNLEPRNDGITNTITTVQKDNLLVEPKLIQNYRIRKLTPRECFRLMGVSEENIDKIQSVGISRTQQYKMAGNSIVVDVLYHIFRKMFIDKGSETGELSLF